MTAQEYQEHTDREKIERVNMLSGQSEGAMVLSTKRVKVSHQNDSDSHTHPNTVQGNYYSINISGEAAGGKFSFLNGELSNAVASNAVATKNPE